MRSCGARSLRCWSREPAKGGEDPHKRTRTNKLVLFPGEEKLIGELVTVRITRPQTWNLYGELV